MATFEDSAVGWTVFRDSEGQASIGQINEELVRLGLGPIANRTFSHYRKLRRLGYSEYVSINRLDLRHSNKSVFDTADRARYVERPISQPVTLIVPMRTSVEVLHGELKSMSEGFGLVRFGISDVASQLVGARKYNKGVLVFDRSNVERAVQVLEGHDTGNQTELLLEFRSLLETDLVRPATETAQSDAMLRFSLGPSPSMFQVVEAMHLVFDLYESTRAFSEFATVDSLDSAPALRSLPTPRVRSLELQNPIELVIGGAFVVIPLIALVLNRTASITTAWAGAVKAVQDIRLASSAEERRKELHHLDVQSRRMDNLKQAVEIAELLEALPGTTRGDAIRLLESADPSALNQLEALKDQAVNAAAELTILSAEAPAITSVDDGTAAESKSN